MDYHFWGITFNRQTNSRENWCTSFIDYSNWYVGRLKSLFWGVWGFFLPCFCASSIRCVQVRGNRKYDFKNIWAPKYWPANHSLFSRMRYNKTIIVKLIKHQSNYRNGFFMTYFPSDWEFFLLVDIFWIKPVNFHLWATNFKRASRNKLGTMQTKNTIIN